MVCQGNCYEDKSASDCLSESDTKIVDFLVEKSVEQLRVVQLSMEEVTVRTAVVTSGMHMETSILSFSLVTSAWYGWSKKGCEVPSGMRRQLERLCGLKECVVVLNCSRDAPCQLSNMELIQPFC